MLRFFSFIIFFNCSLIHAQVIHDSLRVNWSRSGIQSFILDSNTVENIMNHGASGNGISNDFPALQSAFNALSGKSGTVYFPPGTYLFNSPIHVPDSVVIKGEGSDQTFFIFDFNNQVFNCFNFWATPTTVFDSIASGFTKGSDTLVLNSNNATYQKGDFIELRQNNGTWDTQPATWAMYSVGQIVEVDTVIGNTLKLKSSIRLNYDSALNPTIRKFIPRHNAGIQCLRFTRRDSLAPSINYGIYFYYAANCFVKGVESNKQIGAHVWSEYSTNLEFIGNYFHHAYEYSGSSTKGYGLVLAQHSNECKVENNIFSHLRHSMMVKQGANGNAFVHNYSTEPIRSEFPSDAGADISLHGHFPFANLFEGNIIQNLGIDQSWGPAGPYNTFFRNRIEKYGIIVSSGSVQSDKQNMVGNDVTSSQPFQGNYILSGSSHFLYGNNIKGTIQPSGTAMLPDSSYFYNSVPNFWNITQNWPNIGTPNTFNNQNIPARERYLNQPIKTICDSVIVASSEELNQNVQAPFVVVNNASALVGIKFTKENESFECSLMDVSGRLVWKKMINTYNSSDYLWFSAQQFERGLYFLSVRNGKQIFSHSVVIMD